jgi:hypothetical protein
LFDVAATATRDAAGELYDATIAGCGISEWASWLERSSDAQFTDTNEPAGSL